MNRSERVFAKSTIEAWKNCRVWKESSFIKRRKTGNVIFLTLFVTIIRKIAIVEYCWMLIFYHATNYLIFYRATNYLRYETYRSLSSLSSWIKQHARQRLTKESYYITGVSRKTGAPNNVGREHICSANNINLLRKSRLFWTITGELLRSRGETRDRYALLRSTSRSVSCSEFNHARASFNHSNHYNFGDFNHPFKVYRRAQDARVRSAWCGDVEHQMQTSSDANNSTIRK